MDESAQNMIVLGVLIVELSPSETPLAPRCPDSFSVFSG